MIISLTGNEANGEREERDFDRVHLLESAHAPREYIPRLHGRRFEPLLFTSFFLINTPH